MQNYTFTLEAGDDFSAIVTLSGTCSLHQLAETLIKALGFNFDHAFGFYDNLDDPYDSTEKYTLFADLGQPEDGEPGVKATRIQDVFVPGKTLCFLFDYGDDWMFDVSCESVTATKATRQTRRILGTTGTPPVQYEYPDEEDEIGVN